MLYSRVPRSSAWPSIMKVCWLYLCSHCACFSSVAIDCGVSSDESDSKNTRSPTLTTNPAGCRVPHCRRPLSGSGRWACWHRLGTTIPVRIGEHGTPNKDAAAWVKDIIQKEHGPTEIFCGKPMPGTANCRIGPGDLASQCGVLP